MRKKLDPIYNYVRQYKLHWNKFNKVGQDLQGQKKMMHLWKGFKVKLSKLSAKPYQKTVYHKNVSSSHPNSIHNVKRVFLKELDKLILKCVWKANVY